MKSIRRQLTVRLSAALLAAVALAAASLFFAARHAALAEFDATLTARAELLESAIEEDDGHLELEFNLHRLAAWESPDHPTHYAIHSACGDLLIASPHWTTTGFPRPTPNPTAPTVTDFQRADRNYRVLHTVFDAADDTDMAYQGLHLSIARDRSSLDAGLRRAAWLGAATALASLAILVPLLQRTLRSSLQPLEEFARRTDAIDPAKPPVTMETASLPAELSPIAAKLNELLARVHSSILRERRFARDVAHELRTPVAELRTLAELATRWTDEATPEAFSQVLDITSEMEAMVASLTLLNRLEASASPITREPVNLSPILHRLIERSSTAAAAAGLQLSLPDLSSPITWETDATLWKAAASNLLGNAISYSPQGSLITITMTPTTFSVLNPAPSLHTDDLSHMTQPFWRRDKARSASQHSGLGLAIVESVSSLLSHGFTLALTDDGQLAATMTSQIPHRPEKPEEPPHPKSPTP